MTIGVTGSKGFIGDHIKKAVLENGWNVLEFDKPENDLLSPDGEALREFVSKSDVIIHAAAVNRGTDTEVIGGSVVATFNLVSEIGRSKNDPKLIFLSSVQAGNESVYGKSKELAEIMLEDFSKNDDSPVTVLRIANVFGEGCRPFYNSVVATFSYQVAKGEELKVNDSPDRINFVYVGDLAGLIVKEILSDRKEKFHFEEVKSKDEISVPELAELIKSFKDISSPDSLESDFRKNLYKTYLSYV